MILVSYGLFPADRKADFSGPGARLLIGCPGSGDRHVRDVPTRVLHWEMTEPRVPLNYLILVRRMAAFWYPQPVSLEFSRDSSTGMTKDLIWNPKTLEGGHPHVPTQSHCIPR